jgi:hypothetical protein
VQSVGSESRLFRVIEGAAWHRHSARFDSFAGANSDGQSSGNRLVNVTTPTTALKAQSTNHENDGEWLQARPGERCLIRVSAAATNGAYSLVEIVADPGDGTPVRTVADWLHPR